MFLAPLLVTALQGSPPPLVFHGDPRAPAAWVAAADAQLWICWDGPLNAASTPQEGCWQRLPLEMAPTDPGVRLALDASDAASFRLGFLDPRTLALIDERGRAWSIQQGGLPIAAGEGLAEAAQGALSPHLCSPSGWLPRRDTQRRWRWEAAPCALMDVCPIPTPAIRGRPAALDLSLVIDARVLDGQDLRGPALNGARGAQVIFGVAVAVDLQRARLARQELRRLATLTHALDRGLPTPRAAAPLAEREAAALRRARCRAWEGLR